MLVRLSDPSVWRALLAGLAFAALYVAVARVVRTAARWLRRSRRAWAVRVELWRGWPWLGAFCGAAGTLACAFALALPGILAGADLGLGAADWGMAPAVLSIAAAAAGFLALLGALTGTVGRPLVPERSWVHVLLASAAREGQSAIWRAALMPWLGGYWGLWAAAPCALVTRLAARGIGSRPRRVPWDWALDWVSAALFLSTRSLWACLAGRALCASLLYFAGTALSGRQGAQALAQDHGQHDQRGEHGRGQNAEQL